MMTETLEIKVRDDLSRIDRAFNRLLGDETLWKSFLRDPNGVLIDLGLHAPTGGSVNRRCNAIMFATLGNHELLKETADFAHDFFASLSDSHDGANWATEYEAKLSEGIVLNSVDYDMAYIKYLHSHPKVMKRRYMLAFTHINDLRLLTRHYEHEELENYVDASIDAVQRFDREVKFPVLEHWDDHYGVGKDFGVGAAFEIAFDFTAFVGVELAFAVTALGVIRPGDLVETGAPFLDPSVYRKASVLGEMLKMSSDLAVAAGLHLRQ